MMDKNITRDDITRAQAAGDAAYDAAGDSGPEAAQAYTAAVQAALYQEKVAHQMTATEIMDLEPSEFAAFLVEQRELAADREDTVKDMRGGL